VRWARGGGTSAASLGVFLDGFETLPSGADLSLPGPFAITTRSGVTARAGRSIPWTASYPTSPGSPRPLLLFAPGFQIPSNAYADLTSHVASWGFVAVRADPVAGLVNASQPAMVLDLRAVLDNLLAPGALPIAVNAGRIALVGHSLGGELLDGSGGGQACAPLALNYQTFFNAATSAPAAYEWTLQGAAHMDFLTNREQCGLSCSFCRVVTLRTAVTHRLGHKPRGSARAKCHGPNDGLRQHHLEIVVCQAMALHANPIGKVLRPFPLFLMRWSPRADAADMDSVFQSVKRAVGTFSRIHSRLPEIRTNHEVSPASALPVPFELTPARTQLPSIWSQAEPPLSPDPSRPASRLPGRVAPP